jgi:hypothetical protein
MPSSAGSAKANPAHRCLRRAQGACRGHRHITKVTPPEFVDEWLPWVHIVISNFKNYALGTYQGISGRYVHEYQDEFCNWLNRRFWENQIPNRLLKLCVTHQPVLS